MRRVWKILSLLDVVCKTKNEDSYICNYSNTAARCSSVLTILCRNMPTETWMDTVMHSETCHFALIRSYNVRIFTFLKPTLLPSSGERNICFGGHIRKNWSQSQGQTDVSAGQNMHLKPSLFIAYGQDLASGTYFGQLI